MEPPITSSRSLPNFSPEVEQLINNKKLSKVDKLLDDNSKEWFHQANESMLLHPTAFTGYINLQAAKEKYKDKPLKLFLKLCNHLESSENNTVPKDGAEKLKWECANFEALVNKRERRANFEIFVSKVLQEVHKNYTSPYPYQDLPAEEAWKTMKNNNELTSIKSLDLKDSNLTKVPAEISELKNLETLILSNNKLSEFPMEVLELKSLLSLLLGFNYLSEVPDEIANLKKLKILFLMQNKINYISEKIGELKELKQLSLRNNQLHELPRSIGNLTGLTSLDVSNNQLYSLPDSLAKLQFIKNLDVEKNHLQKLPPREELPPQLESISLAGNNITLSSFKMEIDPIDNNIRANGIILFGILQQKPDPNTKLG